MAMTRQERERRNAAFELLLEDMRGWHKNEKTEEWSNEPVTPPASESATELDLRRTAKHDIGCGLHGEIAMARRKRGWTQGELARRAGTSQAAIARLESGQMQPCMRTLQRLAEALGVRLVVRLEVE